MDEIVIKLSIDGTTGNVSLQATDKELQKIVKTVGDANKATNTFADNFVRSFQNIRNVGQGFEQAYGLVNNVFGTGIKKAMEYQLSLAMLNGVILSGGKDSQLSAERMAMVAERFEKSTMFDRDEVLKVQRYFLTFKNLGPEMIDPATEAAMGLTNVLGLDLRGATIALAKALDQGSEGMRALNKLGLKMSDDELNHIKTLEAEGKTYEMQSYVLDILGKKYKDVNAEIQKTDAFKVKQAKDAIQDAQRQAGEMQLLAVQPLLTGLSNMFHAFDVLPGPIKNSIMLTAELTAAYAILNATGIGGTIKNLLTYDFGMRANSIAKLENIIMTKTMTAAEQTQALAAYESAIATKGFFASMGPIGWVIIAVGTLATVWGLLDDSIGKTNETASDGAVELKKQQIEYEGLSKIIKDTSKSENERADAIKEITSKYPEYIRYNQLDNATQLQKNKILDEGNDLFLERIKLQIQNERIEKSGKEYATAQLERESLEKQLKDIREGKIKPKDEARDYQGDASVDPKKVMESEAELRLEAAKLRESQKKAIYDESVGGKKTSAPGKTPDQIAEDLIKTSTGGLTNKEIKELVKNLGEADDNLKNGTEISKRVKARIDEIGGKSRYGKTGGTGLEYLKEDTKMDLEAVNQVKDMYSLIDGKWAAIDSMVMKNGRGEIDDFKTKSQQQKGRFKVREELEKSIDTLMKDRIKSAEVSVTAAGGDKTEILQAKLEAMLGIIAEVEKQSAEWDKKPGRGEFPIISKQKFNEWKIETVNQQNEINRARFEESTRGLGFDEEIISKRMEIENAGEMERVLLRESYLQKELQLAEYYHQAEKVEDLNHKLDMLELDKQDAAKRMLERSRQFNYDMAISNGNKTGNLYAADTQAEFKNYDEQKQKITEDPLLTEQQKDAALIELTEATQVRMLEIKRKYYDAWLGELAGFSALDIETTGKMAEQIQNTFSSLLTIQNKLGQAAADSYRSTENDKLDTQKKAALAGARTEAQKQKIEEQYAKKKEKIDEEANKKGQDKAKTLFALQKGASIATALINTYSGATAALAPPPLGLGPIMGPILAGLTIAAGLANVAVISSQEMPKFALGGYAGMMFRPNGFINGPGTGTSDSILARISNREFVVNAAATERHRLLLENINAGRFAGGGFAGGLSYSNNIYQRSDNGDLVREMQALGKRMDNVMGEIAKIKREPVRVGKKACREIAATGIGEMKREKR